MAELKHGTDDLEKPIAESNYGEDELDQDILSPVDCWELVGSSPSSPSPEALSGDISALEEAVAVACDTGGSLQDNYFGSTHILADNDVLPVSTSMSERQMEDEGHSESVDDGQVSERSDALVSLDSDTDAIENCVTPSSISPITDTGYVHHNDRMYHDDYMQQDDDMCHDDNSPIRHDGRVHHGDTRQSKMNDKYCMSHNEVMEHDEGWHIEDNIMCADEDHAHLSGDLFNIAESMAVANARHDVCASTPSSRDCLALPSYTSTSSHDMEDSYMNIQQCFVQGSGRNITVNESGGDVTGQVYKTRDCVDVRHDTVNPCNSRQHKGIVCASWIWTQLSRWQAQFGCANTIWSVALTAAVMGLLVLGRGWQRLQAQNQTLRTQLWAKEKRITQLMFQLMQTKDSLSKIRRVPVVCVKPSLQIPQGHV